MNEIQTRRQTVTIREGHLGRASRELVRENVADRTITHGIFEAFGARKRSAIVDANQLGPTLRNEIE
jgi:hypothetical protein